jgi:hypothetical protein
MGAIHFQQMYNDALNVDRRAIVSASMLVDPRHNTDPTAVGLWENVAFDEVMAAARDLDDLYATFLYGMRELVVARKATPRICDPATGIVHSISNPDALGFDDQILSEDDFNDVMMSH